MARKQPEAESRNWYRDRYQSVAVQRKILVFITLLSLATTLVTVLVIAQLTPLKTVEPFVIQVDQKSGITQIVDPIKATELTSNEAVNNFFIVQYIRAREGYNPNEIENNYNTVRVMSDANAVYKQFAASVNPNNPQSPIAQLGAAGRRTVRFKSISYIKPDLAQARIVVEEPTDGGAPVQHNRIVLVGFQYTKMALTPEERYINPLGFQVTDYRVDEDVLPQ